VVLEGFETVPHVGVDGSGRHQGRRDVRCVQVEPHRRREAVEAGLGAAAGGQRREAGRAPERRHVDQVAPPPLDHARQERTGQHDRSLGVDAHDIAEISRIDGERRPGGVEPCVVHEDVDVAACDAPFPDDAHQEGARIFPALVPTIPDDPAADANRAAKEVSMQWDKPLICGFSDSDPVTAGGDKPFRALRPGARCAGPAARHGRARPSLLPGRCRAAARPDRVRRHRSLTRSAWSRSGSADPDGCP